MIQTIEAVVDGRGEIRLLSPIQGSGVRRALVTVLDEPASESQDAMMPSEAALADWLRPEEEEAWAYLQSGE